MKLPQDKIWDDHHQALGSFIQAFTALESWLFRELCDVAELGNEIGRALFSGTRADALISLIRRCHEAKGLEIDPLLESVLKQAAVLNTARNDVVHLRYDDLGSGGLVAHNAHRSLPSRSKEVALSPKLMEDMSKDAWQAALTLQAMGLDRLRPGSYANVLARYAHSPWRYKPPPHVPSRLLDAPPAKRGPPAKP